MNRRNFLCSAIQAATATSVLGSLNRIAAATSSTAMQTDYKALVCIFLYGGNDGDNTLIPRSQSEYNAYSATRQALAIPRDQLLAISPTTSDGRQWGFHPSWPEMQTLFGQKKLAVIANTGILLAPTTRDQFRNESVPLPPQLFSHADQQAHWHTSWADQVPRTGWGGRLADAVNGLNTNAQVSMSISLAGSNLFEVGNQVFPYMISPGGVISLWYYNEAWGNQETVVTKTMLDAQYANLFDKTYSETFKRAIENEKKLSGILQRAPQLTTAFPAENDLADQLKMVAKLISVRADLGVKRQIFFCDLQGFDTHGEQPTTQANLLRQLGQAMKAFYDATAELGVADKVTTFTQSDFGRTYKSNGKGSDHGWGNHQFVVGGAVKGGDIYGRVPVQQIGGPDDTSDGRWIPTIASDEYAATMALWFGVGASELPTVLPNINRFNRINLGFL